MRVSGPTWLPWMKALWLAHLTSVHPMPCPAGGPGLEDVVQEVQQVLSEFIRANPKAWAPVISAWSIDLMGQLSSTYSGQHQRVPHATGSLDKLLQLWMGCRATRTLMDIYVQCLSALIGSCPDACVDALLDTSKSAFPTLRLGCGTYWLLFPGTIISRVLSCGPLRTSAFMWGPEGVGLVAVVEAPLKLTLCRPLPWISCHPWGLGCPRLPQL